MVDVVLVHWNQPEACANTAARFAETAAVSNVLVVDNGSSEERLFRLRNLLDPNIAIIEVGFNSGFGPAVNRGWEDWLSDPGAGEWCVVAPHDAIASADTIDEMLRVAEERPEVGMLCADVGDGSRPIVDHVFGPILLPALGRAGFEEADYPHGTLMMVHRRVLKAVGLFDERYFSYCEEADLGLRAKRAGFEVGLVRGAMVENPTVSTASPVVDYLMERNTVLLIDKHFGRRKAAMRFAITIGQFLLWSVMASRRTDYWSFRARALAIADVARQRWGPPPASLQS